MSEAYPVPSEKLDVVIIGAGLSGIAGAYYLQKNCPDTKFTILEMRGSLGGTWDIFKYPGIRSDSPMVAFGYGFKPYKAYQHLADGDEILKYIRETAEENNLTGKIRYKHRVVKQSWSSETKSWTIDVLVGDAKQVERIECNFILSCAGYYDYDQAYDPRFPGREEFIASGRQVLHPQFWPEKIDLEGKRVVVVGSGATAITLVPELSKLCKHVVMVQRSPTYITTMPRYFTKPLSLFYGIVHFLFGLQTMLAFNRWLQIRFEWCFHAWCLACPSAAKWLIWRFAAWSLGKKAAEIRPHLTPSYNPWTQRLCMDADGDFFRALREGSATIHTSALEAFTPKGVRLADGTEIVCDIVVTATGLKLNPAPAKAEMLVDGKAMKMADHVTYRGAMVSDVPNFVFVMGYIYTSWTLRAELVFQWTTNLLNFMKERGNTVAVPKLRPQDLNANRRLLIEKFTPTYFQRDVAAFNRQLEEDPWQMHNQDHFRDMECLKKPLDDGALRFY